MFSLTAIRLLWRNTWHRLCHLLVMCFLLFVLPPSLSRAAPPDVTPLVNAFSATLDALQGDMGDQAQNDLVTNADTELKAEFGKALTAFANRQLPTGGDPRFVRAFLDNTRAVISALDFDSLNDLRIAQVNSALSGSGLDAALENMFHDVAFFTLASDDVLKRQADAQTSDWARRSAPRQWDNKKSPQEQLGRWRDVQAQSRAFAQAFLKDNEHPTMAFYGDPAKPADAEKLYASASLPRESWIDAYAQRLKRLYGDMGKPGDDAFFRDVAQLQYVMTGLTLDNGLRRSVGAMMLQGLEAEIRRSGDPSKDIMRGVEVARGFRETAPVAEGLLPGTVFEDLLAAGYILDDHGAGADHGSSIHSIQLSAFMAYYDQHADEFSYTPVELISAIGAFDARPDNELLFGMERPTGGLWALIMDRPDRNPILDEMSYTDTIRNILREDTVYDANGREVQALPLLSAELDATYAAEIRKGADLLRKYQVDPSDPDLPKLTAVQRLAKLNFAMNGLSNATPGSDDQVNYSKLAGDFLRIYKLVDDWKDKLGYQEAQMPDANGVLQFIGVIVERDASLVLERGRGDLDAIAANQRERARRGELLLNSDDGDNESLAPNYESDPESDRSLSEFDDIANAKDRSDVASRANDDDDDGDSDRDDKLTKTEFERREAAAKRGIEAGQRPAVASPAPPVGILDLPPSPSDEPELRAMTVQEQDEARRTREEAPSAAEAKSERKQIERELAPAE